MGHTDREGRSAGRVLVLLLVLAGLARIAFALAAPLWQEEAFLWMQARRPALCYYHNPPLVSWAIALSTSILGDTTLAVRLPALLFSTLAVVSVHALGLALFRSASVALAGAALVLLFPFFNAFSFVVYHQSPLLAFYALSLLFLARALGPGSRLSSWIALGAASGLAALSQYIAVLLLPTGLLAILCDRDRRRLLLRSPGPYAALATAVLVASPVFVWGLKNDFENFRWHLSVRYDFSRASARSALDHLGLQALAVSPVIYAALLAAAVAAIRRSGDAAFRFVAIAGAVPVAFFFALSPFAFVFAYYAGPGFLALAPGLAALAAAGAKGFRPLAAAGGAVAALATLVMAAGASFHRTADAVFPGVEEHFARERIAEAVLEIRRSFAPGREPFLLAEDDYQAAALAWFARLPDDTFALEHGPGHWQYHRWTRGGGSRSLLGRDAILVTEKIRAKDLARLAAGFESVEPLEPVRFGRGRARRVDVALLRGFRGFGEREDRCPFEHVESYVPLDER